MRFIQRTHRALLLSMIILLIIVLTVPLTVSAQEDEDGENDPDDDMPMTGYLVLAGAMVFSLLVGGGVLLYIRRDTAHNTMNTRGWTIGLVAMIGGIHIVFGLLATFALPKWCIAIYVLARILGWCGYLIFYFVYRKKSVPIIESVPVVYTAKTEKFWKTAVVFGILIFGFITTAGSVFMMFILEEWAESIQFLVVGIILLVWGGVMFNKWLTPGELLIDKDRIQMRTGKKIRLIPWSRATIFQLYRKVVGGGRNRREIEAIRIISPADEFEVTTEDIGGDEFKRMLFVLMYYHCINKASTKFVFNDKQCKQWHDAFLPQLDRLLPRRSLEEVAGGSVGGIDNLDRRNLDGQAVHVDPGSGDMSDIESELATSVDLYGRAPSASREDSGKLPPFDDHGRDVGTPQAGATLIQKPPPIHRSESICPHCGEEVYEDWNVCPFCHTPR